MFSTSNCLVLHINEQASVHDTQNMISLLASLLLTWNVCPHFRTVVTLLYTGTHVAATMLTKQSLLVLHNLLLASLYCFSQTAHSILSLLLSPVWPVGTQPVQPQTSHSLILHCYHLICPAFVLKPDQLSPRLTHLSTHCTDGDSLSTKVTTTTKTALINTNMTACYWPIPCLQDVQTTQSCPRIKSQGVKHTDRCASVNNRPRIYQLAVQIQSSPDHHWWHETIVDE